MAKTIDTLIEDIDLLFKNGKEISDDNLKIFADNLIALIKDRFKKREDEPSKIRMSRIGLKNLKLWRDYHEPIPRTRVGDLKFLYGDIIEQVILLLAKEAGHSVTEEQATVIVDDVEGHTDCIIDGVVVDVKSTSNFAFKKFMNGTLETNDPFGYIAQLSGYMHAYETDKGAFLAVNKETGQIALTKLHPMDTVHAPTRIKEVKEIISSPTPPSTKCYEPEAYGKSGNKALNKNCSFCGHKFKCWADANGGAGIRQFKYANEIVDLVEVLNTPKVEEIRPSGGNNSSQLEDFTKEGEQ